MQSYKILENWYVCFCKLEGKEVEVEVEVEGRSRARKDKETRGRGDKGME